VQIQAYLCAIAQNLKRLLFLLYQAMAAWWSSKGVWSNPSTGNLDRKHFFNTPEPFLTGRTRQAGTMDAMSLARQFSRRGSW
jgi:hypothetical protein